MMLTPQANAQVAAMGQGAPTASPPVAQEQPQEQQPDILAEIVSKLQSLPPDQLMKVNEVISQLVGESQPD